MCTNTCVSEADPTHFIFPLDVITGNSTPSLNSTSSLTLHNRPRLISTPHNNGLLLRDDAHLSAHAQLLCPVSLLNCSDGYTVRFAVRTRSLNNNTNFLSSAALNIFYRDGHLHAVAMTPAQVWRAKTSSFFSGRWNHVEVTWKPEAGLLLFVNGNRHASDRTPDVNNEFLNPDPRIVIGRASTRDAASDYVIDDLELWQAFRSDLIEKSLIAPGGWLPA